MTLKNDIIKWLDEASVNADFFPVEVSISPRKTISIFIDSLTGISIETCVDITRKLYEDFGTQLDSYDVEVSSAGLDRPLILPAQFQKNKEKEVSVLLKDGSTITGILKDFDEKQICVYSKEIIKDPETKKKSEKETLHELSFQFIDKVNLIITLK